MRTVPQRYSGARRETRATRLATGSLGLVMALLESISYTQTPILKKNFRGDDSELRNQVKLHNFTQVGVVHGSMCFKLEVGERRRERKLDVELFF